MHICFLGHQGWSFQLDGSMVLLDPLEQAMGNGFLRLPVWPPRTLLFEEMPRIAGLIISHEHSDHFDLETLLHLPFRGEVHIPDLAADSMRQALMDLGYTTALMHPYVPFEIAGIEFTPLGMAQNPLEPDVYGLLASDGHGHSFLTTIDGVPEPRLGSWLHEHCPERTLDNYTNNEVEILPHLSNRSRGNSLNLGNGVKRLLEFADEFRPRRVAISGQGWSFPLDREAFNHAFFALTNEALAKAAMDIIPGTEWHVPAPGWMLDLGRPSDFSHAPFVCMGDPVDRTFSPQLRMGTIEPWTGQRALSGQDRQQVRGFVESEYGQLLGGHAPQLLAGLHDLGLERNGSPNATLCLRVRESDATLDFQFDRGRLKFEQIELPGDPKRTFALGVEVWASDLKALMGGQEEAFLIYESSVRWWSHCSEYFPDPICIEVFAPFAPRFRSSSYLASYRKHLAGFETRGYPCLK